MPDLLHLSLHDFLSAIAAKQPTPGGGAVTALTGALAASLAIMAVRYTIGKKSAAAHDAELRDALTAFQTAADLLQQLIAEDIAAYEALAPLLKLSPEDRLKQPNFATAVVAAIRAPQTAAGLASAVLDRCLTLLHKTNRLLVSDLGIAATLAHAAVHASELNVLINLPLLANHSEAESLRKTLRELVQKADKTQQTIQDHLLKTL
jgi:formiminotetrahydrofolate cyclodeaminase